MKKIILVAAAFLMASTSFAATLQCWKTTAKDANKPYMTATIESDNTLSNVVWSNYKDRYNVVSEGSFRGVLIRSSKNTFVGNNEYVVLEGETLILPAVLSNDYLTDVEPSGLGARPNENGLIIGSEQVYAGLPIYYEIHLSCRSDL